MESWIPIQDNSDFTLSNLPWGIFSAPNRGTRVGVAIGEKVLDMVVVVSNVDGFPYEVDLEIWTSSTLNDFIALGKEKTDAIRLWIRDQLSDKESSLSKYNQAFVDRSDCTLHLPLHIRDYTDFYSSIEHATNVGMMFRDPAHALLPNWKHIPIGYHGRASSIVVSGTPIVRPYGQIKIGDHPPRFLPSTRVDFELEMAFVVGKETALGQRVHVDKAMDYIFGLVLFNDWSARDIQKWEYVPLGPFLGKSFASSISPWVVPLAALEPFKVDAPSQDPKVLPYLDQRERKNFDIDLQVNLDPGNGRAHGICRSNFKYMYWTMAQQLAHHTSNGCNLHVGDMMASGTISGKTPDSYGSMLELSWGGKNPINLDEGVTRSFLEDGDTVTILGHAGDGSSRVGFGEVSGTIIPA